MRRFWDARAREDALFFVDNRLEYGSADAERFWRDGERDLARLLDLLDAAVEPDDVVLDLGCGVGRLTRPLAERARRVVAVDVSAEMLARARDHHGDLDNVEWRLGDGTSLAGIADGSVDAVVCHVVLQHIPDPAVTLGYVVEMGRVLRPGGWAAFQLSTDPSVHRRRWWPPRLRGPRGQRAPEWVGSAVDVDALRATAAEAGLDLERVEGAGTQFTLVRARRR